MKTKLFISTILCIFLTSCTLVPEQKSSVEREELEILGTTNKKLMEKVDSLTRENADLKKQIDELIAQNQRKKVENLPEMSPDSSEQNAEDVQDTPDTSTRGDNAEDNDSINNKDSDKSKVNETAKGYITKMYRKDSKYYMDIDYVQFLTGEEAWKEAVKHGDEADNDYYIVNESKKIRTFEIAANADISVMDQPGNIDSYRKRKISDFIKIDRPYYFFDIVVKESIVTKAKEIYLP